MPFDHEIRHRLTAKGHSLLNGDEVDKKGQNHSGESGLTPHFISSLVEKVSRWHQADRDAGRMEVLKSLVEHFNLCGLELIHVGCENGKSVTARHSWFRQPAKRTAFDEEMDKARAESLCGCFASGKQAEIITHQNITEEISSEAARQLQPRIQGKRFLLLPLLTAKDGVWALEAVQEQQASQHGWDEGVVRSLRTAGRLVLLSSGLALSEGDSFSEPDSFLRRIADAVPYNIVYADKQLHYRFVNTAHERQLGIKNTDIIGRHVEDIIPEKVLAPFLPDIHRALRGENITIEKSVEWPAGNPTTLRVDLIPDRGSDGMVRGLCVLSQDVREQKEWEAILAGRSRFEELLLNISTEFLSADVEDFGGTLERAVTGVADFMGCGASLIFEVEGERQLDGG